MRTPDSDHGSQGQERKISRESRRSRCSCSSSILRLVAQFFEYLVRFLFVSYILFSGLFAFWMFFDPIVKYFPDRSPYFPATALYFCPILCASVLLSLASVPQFRVTLETHVEIVSSCAIRLVHFFLEGVPSISCSCIS